MAGQITLRIADSDEDLADFRRVRLAVLPGERAASVADMRASAQPDTVRLLAYLDGELVGHGYAGQSDLSGFGSLSPRVLPAARRHGVGTVVLRALCAHLTQHHYDRAASEVDDEASLAFATRFGFAEMNRQVEQVRAIGNEPMPQELPAGVQVVTVASQPHLWAEAYQSLALPAVADFAVPVPINLTLTQWQSPDWLADPPNMFLAVADGQVIGCAGLAIDADAPERAENALTAVRREWRGRGVASALKRVTLARAAELGLREIYTWTQNGNEDMRRLNTHLGYVTRTVSITVGGPTSLDPAG